MLASRPRIAHFGTPGTQRAAIIQHMTVSERASQANRPLSQPNRFSHARYLEHLKQTSKLLASSHLLRREAQNAKTARRSVSSSGTRQDPAASADANRIESCSSSAVPMHPPSLFRLSFLYPTAIYGVASTSCRYRHESLQSREIPTYYAPEQAFYVGNSQV